MATGNWQMAEVDILVIINLYLWPMAIHRPISLMVDLYGSLTRLDELGQALGLRIHDEEWMEARERHYFP